MRWWRRKDRRAIRVSPIGIEARVGIGYRTIQGLSVTHFDNKSFLITNRDPQPE